MKTGQTYAQQMCSHLADYRQRVLGIEQSGTYSYRKRLAKPYEHILPIELKWMNIPEPFRDEVREFVKREGIQTHQHFHHLNSSQALALSLFYPYLTHARKIVRRVLGTGEIESWGFEKIPDAAENTNVDVFWCSGGVTTYCEVKLTESRFGTCGDDPKHRHKLQRTYAPMLAAHLQDESLLAPKMFFAHYQLLRNLWLLAREENTRLVFLLPKANGGPDAQLTAISNKVKPEFWARVRIVYLEQVLGQLRVEVVPPMLLGYADRLAEKYLPRDDQDQPGGTPQRAL